MAKKRLTVAHFYATVNYKLKKREGENEQNKKLVNGHGRKVLRNS